MDEPRDEQPGAESRRPALAAVGELSPNRQAWGRYVTHSLKCLACRDVDQHCTEGDRLYRTWRAGAGEALDQLTDQAVSPPGQ